jgi:hypothetical protein
MAAGFELASVTTTLQEVRIDWPEYQITSPSLLLMDCDLTAVHVGAHPAMLEGISTGFSALAMVTSTNKLSLSAGAMTVEDNAVPESILPHALLVTYLSVRGGEQFPAGGGFQRQRTPLLAEPLWSRAQDQGILSDRAMPKTEPSFSTLFLQLT